METSKPEFKLIIGLGNPDKKYENTYHNVGHLFVDYLTKSFQLKGPARRQAGKSLKTDVYMNESGRFVSRALKKAGIKSENTLVVHDDSDIILGDFKLSYGRGAAGHHGIESIINALGTKNFWRLRIGIRPKPRKGIPRQKAEKFVLKKISASDKKILEEVFRKSEEALGISPLLS